MTLLCILAAFTISLAWQPDSVGRRVVLWLILGLAVIWFFVSGEAHFRLPPY